MVTGKEYIKLYKKIEQEGCDKNCSNCELFLKDRNECVFTAREKWKKWTHEQSIKFINFLREQ